MSTSAHKEFNIKKFLSITTLFGVLNTSFICMVIVPFFKDCGMIPIQLSIILLSKKIVRLFFDPFFGLLFDKYGAKIVFFIGRILKLFSFIILGWCHHSFLAFIIAMLLDGVSYSAIYGKIGAYIYNTLSANHKDNFYSRLISIYYFFADIMIASMSFSASFLVKMYGYNTLIYISIIMNIISLLILLFFIPNNKQQKQKQFISKSFKEIVNTLFVISKTNPVFLYLLIFYGIVNFISWQFGSVISLILLDTGYDASKLAFVGAMYKIITSIGCLLPITLFKNGLKVKTCCKLFLTLSLFGVFASVIYTSKIIVILMCMIVFFYTLIEVSIEKTIDSISDKKVRGTAISIAMMFCSIFTNISIILSGIIAQYLSYKIVLFTIMTCIFTMMFFLNKKLKLL